MEKTVIIHSVDEKKLNNVIDKLKSNIDRSKTLLWLNCKGFFPWGNTQLIKTITSFKEYYAYPTELSSVESVIDLVFKSKTEDILIIDEDFTSDLDNNFTDSSYYYLTIKKSDFLKLKLDTNYSSIKWFLIDLKTQISKSKIYYSDDTFDNHRYLRKVSKELFFENIIYIDGGLGDHIMALPLLESFNGDLHISCKYPFIFETIKAKSIISWDEPLFGGYKRSVYQYGSINNSKTIIDAFFSMYGLSRKASDTLSYKGTRTPIPNFKIDKDIVLICTSAAKINDLDSNKDWSDLRWLKLVHYLQKRGYYVIQVGTTKDNQIPNVDYKMLDLPISNLAYIIEKCKIWISVDTFFHHFASAINPKCGICLTPFYNDHAKHKFVKYVEKDCGKNFYDRRWFMDLLQPERKECMNLIQLNDLIKYV